MKSITISNEVEPTYEGQQMIGICPVTHKKGSRVAKFRKGSLFWWCTCTTLDMIEVCVN